MSAPWQVKRKLIKFFYERIANNLSDKIKEMLLVLEGNA
jgi:hypothetical protein